MKFDFYYGNAGEQFRFLRIPKALLDYVKRSSQFQDSEKRIRLLLAKVSELIWN